MKTPFSAVLLAGGKSSRMGRDKSFIEIKGKPIWRRQVQILEELRPNELFIAGPARGEWRGYEIIPDAREEVGPLGGVASALRHCSTALLLVLAVDLPRMSSEYLAALIESCADNMGVVPRGQPLAAVYPVSARSLAEEALQAGEYSMDRFVTRCLAQRIVRQDSIASADESLFLNLNTPEDFALVA